MVAYRIAAVRRRNGLQVCHPTRCKYNISGRAWGDNCSSTHEFCHEDTRTSPTIYKKTALNCLTLPFQSTIKATQYIQASTSLRSLDARAIDHRKLPKHACDHRSNHLRPIQYLGTVHHLQSELGNSPRSL